MTVGATPKPNVKDVKKNRNLNVKRRALSAMKIKNVQFGFNKSMFEAANKTDLNRIASLMINNKAALKLGGYADSKGDYVYNWKLSKKRADAVKAYLVSKGADSTRIAATEFGETKPIASNDTKAGRKKNRRVELQFVD